MGLPAPPLWGHVDGLVPTRGLCDVGSVQAANAW